MQWMEFFEREPARVGTFVQNRIDALIAHLSATSDWWRNHLSLTQNASLTDWPLLDRPTYRAAIEAAGGALPLPPTHGHAFKRTTSGSSGIPVQFYSSALVARMYDCHNAFDAIHRQRRNLDLAVGVLRNKTPQHDGPHIVQRTKRGEMLFSRKTSQFSIEEHARWLRDTKLAYLYGAPSLLAGMLDLYESGAVAPPDVELIFTFAETVTPELRRRTRSILGARIADQYSCEEVGPLAFQCPHSDEHYHVASTNAVVEILDEQGNRSPPGEVGRVVVTSLHNYASPTIRYELGDLAAWEPRCTCGYPGKVLRKLLGRKRFLLRLPSGERKAIPINTARLFLAIAPFRETRLVQVSEGVLHAELVLDRPLTKAERQAVLNMLRREISPDLSYEVRQVDSIAWAPTYKRQDVVSLV
jgi:phenylacetate-coenzyme A ligase PaaK-like adenylate-forming protein